MACIVISGSPGVGKSSILRELRRLDPALQFVVSHTTRLPRPEENEGDYHYVSQSVFLKMAEAGEFLEYTLQGHTHYGTAWSEVIPKLADSRRHLVFNLDVAGGLAVRNALADTALIFLYAPAEEIERRLRTREKERMSEEEILYRLKKGQRELRAAQGCYDFLIENSQIDNCVRRVRSILDTLCDQTPT